MALPTALFAMIASMGLASAAVMSPRSTSSRASHRDSDSKSAIAAADAGASIALLRLNRYASAFTGLDAAALRLPSGDTLGPQRRKHGGWCPGISRHGRKRPTYTYWVGAGGAGRQPRTVVADWHRGETSARRIAISFKTTTVEEHLRRRAA